MSIIPTMFISKYGVLNISPLSEDSLSLPIILRVMNPPPQNPPSLKSSQVSVLSYDHFNTPLPISSGVGSFCNINIKHFFKSNPAPNLVRRLGAGLYYLIL